MRWLRQVKAPSIKAANLNSVRGTHMVEGEPTPTNCPLASEHTHTHTKSINVVGGASDSVVRQIGRWEILIKVWVGGSWESLFQRSGSGGE